MKSRALMYPFTYHLADAYKRNTGAMRRALNMLARPDNAKELSDILMTRGSIPEKIPGPYIQDRSVSVYFESFCSRRKAIFD